MTKKRQHEMSTGKDKLLYYQYYCELTGYCLDFQQKQGIWENHDNNKKPVKKI